MISLSKKRYLLKDNCTKCGIALNKDNRFVTASNVNYNKCKDCKKEQTKFYAKRMADRKKAFGGWSFESKKLTK